MLRALRNTALLTWFVVVLALSTISLGIWAVSIATQVASLTATMATNAIAHRQTLIQSAARLKAKARLRRLIVAVPIAGLASIAYFEEHDYQEWLEDNPDGDRAKYACEVATITAEVLNEVLQELPESIQPSPDTVQYALDRYVACED